MRLQIVKGKSGLASEDGATDGSKEAQDASVATKGNERVTVGKAGPKSNLGKASIKPPKGNTAQNTSCAAQTPPHNGGNIKTRQG